MLINLAVQLTNKQNLPNPTNNLWWGWAGFVWMLLLLSTNCWHKPAPTESVWGSLL